MSKVLIVEDNESIRTVFTRVLERGGYDVLQAATTKTGLDLIKDPEVNVALIDVRLGDDERGGFKVAQAADRAHTWLVAVSGSCLTDDEAMRAIFDEVVEKPISFPDLLAVTKRYYEKRREPAKE